MENLYIHKTKALDATPVKQKCGRPSKPKSEIQLVRLEPQQLQRLQLYGLNNILEV